MLKLGLVLLFSATLALTAYSGDRHLGEARTARAQETPEQQAQPVQEAPLQQDAPADLQVGTAEDDGGGVPTSLIVLGVLLVLLLVLLFFWWNGRATSRAAEQSTWRHSAVAAHANGEAVHDDLTVQMAATSRRLDSSQEDVDRRMSDLTVQFHALEIAPPNTNAADSLQDVLGTLATLQSAVQANLSSRSSGHADEGRMAQAAALVRRRLAEFDGSLTAFKAAI